LTGLKDNNTRCVLAWKAKFVHLTFLFYILLFQMDEWHVVCPDSMERRMCCLSIQPVVFLFKFWSSLIIEKLRFEFWDPKIQTSTCWISFFFLIISRRFRVIRWFRKVFMVLLGENKLKNGFSTQKTSPLHRFFKHHNYDRILGGYPTHDMLFDSISNMSFFFKKVCLLKKKKKSSMAHARWAAQACILGLTFLFLLLFF